MVPRITPIVDNKLYNKKIGLYHELMEKPAILCVWGFVLPFIFILPFVIVVNIIYNQEELHLFWFFLSGIIGFYYYSIFALLLLALWKQEKNKNQPLYPFIFFKGNKILYILGSIIVYILLFYYYGNNIFKY